MSLTLIEASKLSNDMLLRGIIEQTILDSPILQELPFIQIVGNSLRYNREAIPPAAAWHAPLAAWPGAIPQRFEDMQTTLAVLGQDADVDHFIKATRADVQDVEAVAIAQVAKGVRMGYEDMFINGDPVVTPNQPQGLRVLIGGTAWTALTVVALGDFMVPTAGLENGFRYECTTAGTTDVAEPAWPVVHGDTVVDGTVTWTCRFGGHLAAGFDGAVLTLPMLDQLIDNVRGGKPDMLLMSKRSRRQIVNLARAAGSNLEIGEGKLGQMVQLYNGIPVHANDWIPDDLVVNASGPNCSLIFALTLGPGGVCGLSSPEMLQYERIGMLENFDAARTRIKWYCGLAHFSAVNNAMLAGVM